MGFLLVTSVLVVSLGRVGDIFGAREMYTLGFAIFTLFSVLLAVTWMTGPAAAMWIIVMRWVKESAGRSSSRTPTQSSPTPSRQRAGFALGINGVAAIGGSFLGLILGGVLAPSNGAWCSCVGALRLFGTVWAHLRLRDNGRRHKARIDWTGNVTFAVGLIAVLTGIVYGLQPYGGPHHGLVQPLGTVLPLSAAWRSWCIRPSSNSTPPIRCSTWTSSRAGPSPWGTWLA